MPDRTVPPPSESIRQVSFPEPEKKILEKDIPLYVIRQGLQPVILLDLVIPVGRWNETLPGITYFASKMLTEGTTQRNAREIAEMLDFHGSHFEISPTLDHVSFRLYSLKKFFPELLSLVVELLTDSEFPSKEFELLKKIRLQQVKEQMAKNNLFAGLKFREALFGPSHPYGVLIDEKKTLEPSLEQVTTFYKNQFFRRPRVYLAGNVDDSEIRLLEKKLFDISFISNSADTQISTAPVDGFRIKKGSGVQASLKLGNLTIDRNHTDIHDLKITNELFGGFFGSRLMKNIREEKGLTYGIHSHITHLKHGSFWEIGTEVLLEKVELAIEEILREIEKLQNNPPQDEEMETLRNYMKGKFLMSFDTPFNTLEMIKTLHRNDLDTTFWTAFTQRLETITPENIAETARKYMNPDHLCKVIVE